MSDISHPYLAPHAVKCLAYGGAGTLFALVGGVFTPLDLACAGRGPDTGASSASRCSCRSAIRTSALTRKPIRTLRPRFARPSTLVNGMADQPALIIHTGDITHLSKAGGVRSRAATVLGGFRVPELHTVPGEHDTTDAAGRNISADSAKRPPTRGITASITSECTSSRSSTCSQFKARWSRHARRGAARLGRRRS